MLNNESMMDEVLPVQFFLSQNYPNPFRDKTVIKYCVPAKSRVAITVYNSEGDEILKLVDGVQRPGTYEVEFDASQFLTIDNKAGAAGRIYFYAMQAGEFTSFKEMIREN